MADQPTNRDATDASRPTTGGGDRTRPKKIGNGAPTGPDRPFDTRDVEIARLRSERDEWRARERVARAEVDQLHKRLILLSQASKRLAAHELAARAQAEERRRLSRELHDRVAHDMALVHQSLELHAALKESDPERAEAKMELAKAKAKEALHSTRNLSMELRQPEVREGLRAALSDLLHDVSPPAVDSRILIEGNENTVPPALRNQLFVILREAVRNAVTHSGCANIVVGLNISPERVVGYVEDDGRGFDAAESRWGGGLKSMHERTALAGAKLEISRAPNRGTKVMVSAPLQER